MKLIKKQPADRIEMAIRDRPFERAITMQKNSVGHVGFVYNDGKITSIVKDSSAARNGLLIEHNLLEVNGQNVVGLKVGACLFKLIQKTGLFCYTFTCRLYMLSFVSIFPHSK